MKGVTQGSRYASVYSFAKLNQSITAHENKKALTAFYYKNIFDRK